MRKLRRKIVVPSFCLTEVCVADDPGAVKRSIGPRGDEQFVYHIRPVIDSVGGTAAQFNLMPVILDSRSAPWDLGMQFLFGRLDAEINPNMLTIRSLADDLSAFRFWLDGHDDPNSLVTCFPKMKLRRVTYRYRGALKQMIEAGDIAASTAKRRMGTVVQFYRWMIEEKVFAPENDPWEERTYSLTFKGTFGAQFTKKVLSTDLALPALANTDPFDGTIYDEGKLRPLSMDEQKWILKASSTLGNPEMSLLLLVMLLTGARIQTASTLRVEHFSKYPVALSQGVNGNGLVFKLNAGPGTSIDTKGGKRGVLHFPAPLYEALHIYGSSIRAQRRRARSPGGDHGGQYLFLTQQGTPYYAARRDSYTFDPDLKRRYQQNGGTVRQFLKDHLIPFVRSNFKPDFNFKPHDLRASFGMNQTDMQMSLVRDGLISLSKARTNVMALMWHSSTEVTDKYLNYREHIAMIYAAVNGYGDLIHEWVEEAMKGAHVS